MSGVLGLKRSANISLGKYYDEFLRTVPGVIKTLLKNPLHFTGIDTLSNVLGANNSTAGVAKDENQYWSSVPTAGGL